MWTEFREVMDRTFGSHHRNSDKLIKLIGAFDVSAYISWQEREIITPQGPHRGPGKDLDGQRHHGTKTAGSTRYCG